MTDQPADETPGVTPDEEAPTRLEHKVGQLLSPFQTFIRDQTTGSVILILCTVAALTMANTGLADNYFGVIHTSMGVFLGDAALEMSVRHWINEGLMTMFFFVLGLEIKRELLAGELKDTKRSLPVIFAAVGGMVVPAAIFVAFTAGTPSVQGWGIPMATDAAFAVGILALLGGRVPYGLTAFLTALAIIDDLGAIAVIAVFYSEDISTPHLAVVGGLFGLLVLANLLGFRRAAIYVIGGTALWLAMLGSGVHATVAGVLLAIAVPARPRRTPGWFIGRARRLVERLEEREQQRSAQEPVVAEHEQHAIVDDMQESARVATTPLRRWERALDHPVSLLVMPIFALANAGIAVDADTLPELAGEDFALGLIFGLLVGKTLGITAMTWLALRLGLGRLPTGVAMRHIVGIGLLGGMGFTMSIFIAGLNFEDASPALVLAKAAILSASLVAGVSGYLWLRLRGAPAAD